MRIKELSDVSGVTIRTIRYYHQIGLLPVPDRRDGRRDYDLTHVARIARVRWLTQAGIPLATIATMLDEPHTGHASVLADLTAGVAALDQQLADLHAQRHRITVLIGTVTTTGRLSPMPAAMARFYDEMHERATDEKTRRVIRRERDFVELAFYRGDMPPETQALYEALTEANRAESSALYTDIAGREDDADRLDDREIDRIADAVVDRIARHLGPKLPAVLRSIDVEVARRAADLYVRLSPPHHRRLDRAIADALLTTIEKGHLT